MDKAEKRSIETANATSEPANTADNSAVQKLSFLNLAADLRLVVYGLFVVDECPSPFNIFDKRHLEHVKEFRDTLSSLQLVSQQIKQEVTPFLFRCNVKSIKLTKASHDTINKIVHHPSFQSVRHLEIRCLPYEQKQHMDTKLCDAHLQQMHSWPWCAMKQLETVYFFVTSNKPYATPYYFETRGDCVLDQQVIKSLPFPTLRSSGSTNILDRLLMTILKNKYVLARWTFSAELHETIFSPCQKALMFALVRSDVVEKLNVSLYKTNA